MDKRGRVRVPAGGLPCLLQTTPARGSPGEGQSPVSRRPATPCTVRGLHLPPPLRATRPPSCVSRASPRGDPATSLAPPQGSGTGLCSAQWVLAPGLHPAGPAHAHDPRLSLGPRHLRASSPQRTAVATAPLRCPPGIGPHSPGPKALPQ